MNTCQIFKTETFLINDRARRPLLTQKETRWRIFDGHCLLGRQQKVVKKSETNVAWLEFWPAGNKQAGQNLFLLFLLTELYNWIFQGTHQAFIGSLRMILFLKASRKVVLSPNFGGVSVLMVPLTCFCTISLLYNKWLQ